MDKFLGLLMVLGIGVPLITISFLIIWVMDNEDDDKREFCDDSDTRLYIPSKCRRDRGDRVRDERGKG